ncbi:MAG: polysaccharide biosynthesis/export family protein, partial [Terriglobales bacterium]
MRTIILETVFIAAWLAAGACAGAQTLTQRSLAPAPDAATPAGAEATVWGSAATADPVGPGDLLDVRVFGQPQLSGSLRVAPDGVIAPPFLASMNAAGETPLAIQAALTTAYGKLLKHPMVSVRLVENNSRKISINGIVPRPGVYTFSGQLSLLQALALAGGVDPSKASPNILVFHQPPVTEHKSAQGKLVYTANSILQTIDISRIGSDPALNQLIQPGDVIDVQPVRQVYLSGDVMHPGAGALVPGMTLAQLISAAGGFLPQANHTVRVLRLEPN